MALGEVVRLPGLAHLASLPSALTNDEVLDISQPAHDRGMESYQEEYRAKWPFPHWIQDGMIDPKLVAEAADEFPPPSDPRWKTYTGERERGKQEWSEGPLHCPNVNAIVKLFTGHWFMAQLADLTGEVGLEPELWGGGMHQSPPGALLDMHVDFNRHPNKDMDRRINLILFLSEVDGGGELDLLVPDGNLQAGITIPPKPNRLVVFECGENHYHGHPNPVQGERMRKSIAVYYYLPARAGVERPAEHSTKWLADELV